MEELSMQRLILAYKNFAANKNISHIGLGVSAPNTCKVLRREGIAVEVCGQFVSPAELLERLREQPASHVVVSALGCHRWRRIGWRLRTPIRDLR